MNTLSDIREHRPTFKTHVSLNAAALAAGTGIFGGSDPANVEYAEVTIYGGSAQLRYDATNPAGANDGQRLPQEVPLAFRISASSLANIRIRSFSGTVTAEVDLFAVGG
jgi:hypothetical protein